MKYILPFITCIPLFASSCLAKQEAPIDTDKQPEPIQIQHKELQKHTQEELKYFFIDEIEFKDSNFQNSVQLLLKHYQNICKETLEIPLPIKFQLNENTPIKKRKVSMKLGGNFDYILKQLCVIYNVSMECKDHTYHFSRIADQPEENKTITTKNLYVPVDLFTENGHEDDTNLDDFKSLLGSKNLELKFLKKTSTLIVRGPQAEITQVTAFVNNLLTRTPIQIKVLPKLISFPPKKIQHRNQVTKIINQGILNQSQFQILMRLIAQNEDTTIITFPSIVARFEENAVIEIIKEDERGANFLGHKLDITPTLKGLSTSSQMKYKYHSLDGMEFSQLDSSLNDTGKLTKELVAKINKYHINFNLNGRDNHTHILKLNVPQSPLAHYLLITPVVINAAGMKIKK